MVTALDVANLFVQREEVDDDIGTQRAVTIRMDHGQVAYLDAMASQAGISRNLMANHLLEVGMQAVMGELSSEAAESVMAGVADRMGEL